MKRVAVPPILNGMWLLYFLTFWEDIHYSNGVITERWPDDTIVIVVNVCFILSWIVLFYLMKWRFHEVLTRFLFLLWIVAWGISLLYGPPFAFVFRRSLENGYPNEALSVVSHIRTQIGLYQYEHDTHLPFDDADVGTVTTWRKTDNGQYVSIQFILGGSATNVLSSTNNVFSCLGMSVSDVTGKKLTPDQVYMACVVPGGVSEDGATTNACAYAIGVFGNGEKGLSRGTGYAVLEVCFPDVNVVESEKWKVESAVGADLRAARDDTKGYRLVATWENYSGDNTGNDSIRFGLDPEPGVCTLIPPEVFAPGAVTNLLGRDDPGAVEYWVERLRSAPCGKWEIPELR